jgi:hypothetical protein
MGMVEVYRNQVEAFGYKDEMKGLVVLVYHHQ